jgi:hypothetical protein
MGSDNSRAQVTSQQSGVLFSANSRVQTTVNSSVIASTDSQVNSATQSAVLASTLSIINGALLSANLICATNNVTLTSCTGAFSSASNGGGANGSQWSSLQSCSSTSIIGAANSSALCSNAGSIGPGSTYSMLACGTTSNLTGNYIAAFGNNVLVAANNNAFIFSDSSAGTISPPNNDSFTVRATGATAAVFYTNAAATTGVQIAAGASAWAAVSDRTLKENLVLLDTDWAAQTVSALPIYTYNFIGNPVEQRCIGPMAQDWAALYPTNKSSRHIDTGDIAGITLGALQNILRRLAVLEEMVGVKKL